MENKSKSKEYKQAYYQNNKERIKKYQKEYHDGNRPKVYKEREDDDERLQKKTAENRKVRALRVNMFIQEWFLEHYELISWDQAERKMKKEEEENGE